MENAKTRRMLAALRQSSTGKRGVRKRTRLVWGRAGGKGLFTQYLACGLSYFLVGVHGSKADAEAIRNWLEVFLRNELQIELSEEKTLITNAKQRVRFLGYDIKRWSGNRVVRSHTCQGVKTKRTGTYQLTLLMPADKTIKFAQEYGETTMWQGRHRSKLLNLSELEILMTYNAEVRGFLGYYSLADYGAPRCQVKNVRVSKRILLS